LIETSERDELAGRHAAYLTELLHTDPEGLGRVQSLRAAVHELDNVRGILNLAFSPNGSAPAGVLLAAHAAPVWLESSLLTE